jgi:hypothetical protein
MVDKLAGETFLKHRNGGDTEGPEHPARLRGEGRGFAS